MIRQLIVASFAEFPSVLENWIAARTKHSGHTEKLLPLVEARLRELLGGYTGDLIILGIPTLDWQIRLTQAPPRDPPAPQQLVISLAVPDTAALYELRRAVEEANKQAGGHRPLLAVGADLALAESEYFCPANVDQLLFGDRDAAAALTRSKVLKQRGLTGRGVNIVVIDEGFDATQVRNFGGGLANGPTEPGTTKRGHGLMVVRNILDAAPDATFYDVPLIPTRISDAEGFIATALDAFNQLKLLIEFLRQFAIPPWNGPWVLVNAWSIFDRSSEQPPGDYTENPNHPFNRMIDAIVNDGVDIIFAAGNCGQFCPDRRCGKRDMGPGSSIFGANSHPRVLSTGAVRTDARWVGSSSQGPGQLLLCPEKPDLCAPSYFREVGDAFVGNLNEALVGNTGSPYIASTGTSAACGLTAGIIGAIRSQWDQRMVSPDQLKRILNYNARKTEGPGWNERLGNGIIDVEATLSALRATPPRGGAN